MSVFVCVVGKVVKKKIERGKEWGEKPALQGARSGGEVKREERETVSAILNSRVSWWRRRGSGGGVPFVSAMT